MLKFGLYGFILFMCMSCANTNKDEFRIRILLNPKFPVTLGLTDSGPAQAHLMDNDGNVYITYWDVDDESYDVFSRSIKECKKPLRSKRLFLSSFTIHEYNVEDIEPSLYKTFALCLGERGFTKAGEEAHYPEYFELSFTRTHNTNWNYMAVGSKFIVTKPNTPYIEVFKDTIGCDSDIISSGTDVTDTYGYDYRRVSIEQYVKDFDSCLSSLGYDVENTRPDI